MDSWCWNVSQIRILCDFLILQKGCDLTLGGTSQRGSHWVHRHLGPNTAGKMVLSLRLLKFSAWIRFDYIWKVMYVLFWRNTEEINMFFCNMKKHVLYQLSVCIQVIHHYRFFCPTKTQVFIHRTHSLLVPFGWHRQNWHRSSRYSPELAFLVSKNIGSDGSEIQPVMENLPFCVWVRWKNLNISLKWRGFFTL